MTHRADNKPEGFGEEFAELFENCRPYLTEFHERAVRKLMNKSRSLFSSDKEDHKEACYHLKAGLVTFLLRELEKLDLSKKEEVGIILMILENFIDEHRVCEKSAEA